MDRLNLRARSGGLARVSPGTTTMINDHGRKIKSGTPPRTSQPQPASNAQLNRTPEWTPFNLVAAILSQIG
jgi:hypothetical protein